MYVPYKYLALGASLGAGLGAGHVPVYLSVFFLSSSICAVFSTRVFFFYNQVKILKQSLTPSLYHFYSLQLRSAHSKLHRSVSMATYKQYGCCLMLTYMFRLSSLLCSNLFRQYCRWPIRLPTAKIYQVLRL